MINILYILPFVIAISGALRIEKNTIKEQVWDAAMIITITMSTFRVIDIFNAAN